MLEARKIVMLVENLSVPADRRVWAEAQTLQAAGFQVCIICPKGSTHDQDRYVCIKNIHIFRYTSIISGQSALTYLIEYAFALWMIFFLSIKVSILHGFDVIHMANPPDLLFLIGLFYRICGKKLLFDQHDLAPEMFQARYPGRGKFLCTLLLLFERWSYRVADTVIVTNKSQQERACKRGHCPPSKVVIVRNGPDLEQFKLVPPEPELKRGYPFLLVYLGIMGAQDNVECMLYALDDLVHKRGRRDVALVLLGTGDTVSMMKELTHKLQLDEHVRFNGWTEQPDILRYLSTADIGLSPDPLNGLNEFSTMIKVMEYMAMSKPVVAFDLVETYISAQDGALYARPNDIEDFASKIEILLKDEELRRRIGALGRKRIEEELNWEHAKYHLLQAYHQLFLIPPGHKPSLHSDDRPEKPKRS